MIYFSGNNFVLTALGNNFVLTALVVLASGYIVHDAPICRFFWPRYTGYILYFRIITVGIIFSIILSCLLYGFACFGYSLPYVTLENTPFLALLLAVFLRILAAGIIWIACKRWPKLKHVLQLKGLSERGFDEFVYEKIKDGKMILITLENKKVYAGLPLAIPNNETTKWLRFAPYWSGYRNEKSAIEIQSDYSRVLNTSALIHNAMLIPVEKITSAQPFDIDTFRQFND